MAEISQRCLLNSKRTDSEARRRGETGWEGRKGRGGNKKQIESGSGWCDYCCQVSSCLTSLPSSPFCHAGARDAFDTLDPKACTANDCLPRCHLHVRIFLYYYFDDLHVSRTTLLWLMTSPVAFCFELNVQHQIINQHQGHIDDLCYYFYPFSLLEFEGQYSINKLALILLWRMQEASKAYFQNHFPL